MFIAIDGNEANIKERVGVSTYAFEILWGLSKLNKKKKQPLFFKIYLKRGPNDDLPKEDPFWKYEIIKGERNWVLKNLMPSLFKKPHPGVFFSPSHYLPLLAPTNKVMTIHDLGYLDFSEQFRKYDFWQLKYWTAISIYVSKYIISVSNATKKDIVRRYPFASKKVRTIHHGYDKERFNAKISKDFVRRVRKKYGIPENYILFLSTLKPSKNIEGLIGGFGFIKDQFQDYKLVIAGKKGWLFEPIYKKVEDIGLKDRVIFTDYIPEKDKPALFSGAKVFVLPSYWEGFGMDVLNALSCGTPAVISRVASLPEIAGDAGVYVDPNKPESIAEGLKQTLSMNDVKYNDLVRKGFDRVKEFSWEKSASVTFDLLKKAL
jgi:glycosyltransferase involved in cell wall biosynthesis